MLNLAQDHSFIQEYILRPLLIDQRKFDIGIYTVVTSILPLRVYIYEGDILLRFCPLDYHPFDPDIPDKYVVGDDYTPTWKLPSLSKYYTGLNMTFRETLNAHLRSIGKEPERIWTQIRATIRQVFQAKQMEFQSLIGNYKSHANFFELSRFDFGLNEDLDIFLMEANMSPNLSSGHFEQNKLLYEQVLFNLFSLVGIATHLHGESLQIRSINSNNMLVSDRDISVFPQKCLNQCSSCQELQCNLCANCLSKSTKSSLKLAYSEHVSRRNMRRIIPNPEQKSPNPHATAEDGIGEFWFQGKCLQDPTWCY